MISEDKRIENKEELEARIGLERVETKEIELEVRMKGLEIKENEQIQLKARIETKEIELEARMNGLEIKEKEQVELEARIAGLKIEKKMNC